MVSMNECIARALGLTISLLQLRLLTAMFACQLVDECPHVIY